MPRIISIARSRPDAVLRRQVLGYVGRYLRFGRFRSPSGGSLPSRFLCAARDRRGLRRSGRAGSPLAVGVDGAEPTAWRVTLDDDDGRVRAVAAPALAVARGLAVAAFALLTVLDALLVARLPFQGEGGDAIGAVLIVGFFNLLAVALSGAVSGHGAAPPPARPAVRDRARLRGHGAARDDLRRHCSSAGCCTAVRAWTRSTPTARGGRAPCTTTWPARRPRSSPASRRSTRASSSPTATAPASYSAAERLPLCLFVNTDQSPPGRDP